MNAATSSSPVSQVPSSAEEWVCPVCRASSRAPLLGAPLVRCSTHGRALVPPRAAAASAGDPMLGRVVGRFALLERLGSGSMGTVYRARQEGFARDVAVKVLRPDQAPDAVARARFAREAHALSLLRSPHTVMVFDFGTIPSDTGFEEDSSMYLAMELLEGESLGARLRRSGPLAPAEAVHIARQVLESLAEAHENGLVHRDLKPDNVFLSLDPDGTTRCKVLDFGVAKFVREAPVPSAAETQAGTVFGTPRYISQLVCEWFWVLVLIFI
jgi:serine/threonine protein kinase